MTTATTSKQSAEERALERFGEMLISKIETIKEDWHKPWFTEGACVWARNLDGRGYNGINAFMLAMLCENKGYELPVFSTFERIAALNNEKTKDDKPMVIVKKGEKSFPVFLTTFTVIDKDGNKIPYDEYIKLSDDEKEYLDSVKEVLSDGEMSPRDRKLLNRLRDSLGISEERAAELEKSV